MKAFFANRLNVVLLVISSGAALYWGYVEFQHRFLPDNIQIPGLVQSVPPIDQQQRQELIRLFSKPFAYLDRGKQSYAFLSSDHKFVLKFFDTRCLHAHKYIFFGGPNTKRCQTKLNRLVTGYQVAYTQDRDHSGLFFVQLAPDASLDLKVDVTDRFGFKHTIDLSQVPFVVQERAIPTRKLLKVLFEKGEVAQAKYRLRQIIDMYVDEYQRGLYDRDHNFMYNTGFVDEKPIRIDMGRLKIDEKMRDPKNYAIDLKKIAIERTGGWMQRHFPQYRAEVLEDMQAKLSEVLGEAVPTSSWSR